MRVLFLHPDLGIGGAERLVVDAALALQSKGHVVSILTNHHDVQHCFQETRDGTLAIQTVGDWIPRKIFGRFYALCAYIRMIYAALYTVFVISKKEKIDIIFCDQISLGIPILKYAKNHPKIIFYCHFPDQLLSKKGNLLKTFYRYPLDYCEEITTKLADCILVNSKFTGRILKETFKRIDTMPELLYPSINTKFFDEAILETNEVPSIVGHINARDSFIFLSINRYERKKNIPLAVEAFHETGSHLTSSEWDKCHLVIAGGYDARLDENVQHFKELENLAKRLNIIDRITLLRSPTDNEKISLLKMCHCLIYTPENEHFGIVPIEGMYMTKPIIAVKSGGPMETIVHESTGFLCEQNKEEFAKAMIRLVKDPQLGTSMGEKGRKRVEQYFSFEAFTNKLNNIIHRTDN